MSSSSKGNLGRYIRWYPGVTGKAGYLSMRRRSAATKAVNYRTELLRTSISLGMSTSGGFHANRTFRNPKLFNAGIGGHEELIFRTPGASAKTPGVFGNAETRMK